MKTNKLALIVLGILIVSQSLILAQYAPRQDAIWAKYVPAGTITMDGVLNELAWAKADSIKITYGQPGLLPTSGYKKEIDGGPGAVTDPTHATIKFLVSSDNQLWLAFDIPDSSIGGTFIWPKFDAILMSVKNKLQLDGSLDASPSEIFYTYWTNSLPDSTPVVGSVPRIVGSYGNYDGTPRTPAQIAVVDARTVVNGTSNDAERDQGWVTEMRINLDSLGYNINQPDGDFIALNFSIWDNDFLFENDPLNIYTTKTYYQCPWGNVNTINVARVYGSSNVGLDTPLPLIAPDLVIPSGANYPDPVIDGKPDEDVWAGAYTFNLGWDIEKWRVDYPGVGKFMSGRYRTPLPLPADPEAPIIDPSEGTIKMFFRGKYLYLSADITDGYVQGTVIFDKIDGVRLTIGHRTELNDVENNMVFKQLRVNLISSGVGTAAEYLSTLIDSGKAEFGLVLKPGTTVNDNSDFDQGFTIEMKIDLTGLGYPEDLGDKLLFCGVMLADGDSFDDPSANYGTRSWWFRQQEGEPVVAWAVLDPNTLVGVEDEKINFVPNSIQLYGNYPNPFNPSTTIKFAIPETGDVNISIYNTLGEEMKSVNLSNKNAGELEYSFNATSFPSGVYFYKITLSNSATSINYLSKIGKMILLK
jgi:hypothetical protein